MSANHKDKIKVRNYKGAYVNSLMIPRSPGSGMHLEGVLIEFQNKALHSNVIVTVLDCKTISVLLTMEKFVELYDGWQDWNYEKLYDFTMELYRKEYNNKQLHQIFVG